MQNYGINQGRNMNGFKENGILKLEKSRRIQYENERERERACWLISSNKGEKDWNSQRVLSDQLGDWMNRCLDCEIFKNMKLSQLEVWLEVDVNRIKYGLTRLEVYMKREVYSEWTVILDLEIVYNKKNKTVKNSQWSIYGKGKEWILNRFWV